MRWDKGRKKHAAYALLALAMLVYGATAVEPAAGWGWRNAFAGLWSAMALLVFAAHVQRLLMSERTAARLQRVKRERFAALERRLAGRLK